MMASNQLLCFFLVTVVLFFSFVSSPSFAATEHEEEEATAESGDAVTLSLYYETLCPYCANFIVNQLVKLFDTGLISIVNLRLIPWGNAWRNSDGTIVCQHGADECFLNAIEACTITIYPQVERHFSFIRCIEQLILENKSNEWSTCFEITRLGEVPVDCYETGYGKVLEEKYGDETDKLNPPHRFVPWVVVNDKPLEEDYENFMAYICNAYKGNRVPDACRSLPLNNNQYDLLKASSIDKVCYLDGGRNLSYAEAQKKNYASEQELWVDQLKKQP